MRRARDVAECANLRAGEGRLIDVRFVVLGPLEIRAGPLALPVPVGRQRRLLAALLLARGSVVTAERLIDLGWGEDPPVNARNTLQTSVTRLRRSLAAAGEIVVHRPPGYRLDLSSASLDADDFVRLVDRARTASGPGQALELLDQALALWRGPAWGELAADVARADALRLEELRLTARERRAAALLELGRPAEAAGSLELLLSDAPLRDGAVGLLVRALQAAGRPADGLAVIARHRRLLADELGLDLPPELAGLQERLLRQERRPSSGPQPGPPSAPRELPPSAPRELPPSAPAPPPPTGGQARPGTPPPLPRRASALAGREQEAAQLRRLLADRDLVTVVGPGGVGKTRLAHHVVSGPAEDADSGSPEPVWWVDLAAVRDASALPQVVADAVGAEPFPGASIAESLPLALARRTGVLVLDGCEHLVTAVAHLVAGVLSAPAGLRLLATSRERLGVEGEQVMVLPPLPVPDRQATLAQVRTAPAVALFLDRARAAAPDLEPGEQELRRIAQLCRSLDGLPLAIELAAARIGALTVDDLADRIDARFELLTVAPRTGPAKHRTLRAVVDWSYDLLEPVERTVFEQLAVFPARFDLTAAEAVAGDGLSAAATADVVARLAERSMLVRPRGSGQGRYRMLETLRQYALQRLDGDARAEVRSRHARWVLAVAEEAELGLLGPAEPTWNARLTELLPDLRAAFAWARQTRDGEVATRLTGALLRWAYWQLRSDVLDWGAAVLADGLTGPRQVDAYAASAAARWVEGRLGEARALADQGIRLGGGASSPAAAVALSILGDTALCAGDLDEAAAAFAASHRSWTASGRTAPAVMDRLNELIARTVSGQPAAETIEAAVARAVDLGNPSMLAFARYVQAEAIGDAAPERAQRLLAEALRLADSVENRLVAGIARTAAVSLRGRHGRPDAGSFALFHDAISHWHRAGSRPLLLTTLRNLVPLLVRAGLDEAAIELAAAVEGCAGTKPTFGPEAERLVDAVAHARARLGADRHAAAWDRGCARVLDEATDTALAVLRARTGDAVPSLS